MRGIHHLHMDSSAVYKWRLACTQLMRRHGPWRRGGKKGEGAPSRGLVDHSTVLVLLQCNDVLDRIKHLRHVNTSGAADTPHQPDVVRVRGVRHVHVYLLVPGVLLEELAPDELSRCVVVAPACTAVSEIAQGPLPPTSVVVEAGAQILAEHLLAALVTGALTRWTLPTERYRPCSTAG